MVLLLLGVLLAVIALPVSDEKKGISSGISESEAGESEMAAQQSALEKKLELLLSNAEGVGKVQVIVMTGEQKDIAGFYESDTPDVTGVLICAEGGDNSVVVQQIQQAVMALFQVEAHKIKVMKMK